MAADLPHTFLRQKLLLEGLDDSHIRAGKKSGLHTVRAGAYANGAAWGRLNAEQQHLMLIAATLPKLDPGAVVSHVSAAIMHGLPIIGTPPAFVHITRDRSSGGSRRGCLHTHAHPLDGGAVTSVGGLAVTSVIRTVIDCARTLTFECAVSIADRALRLGMTSRDELSESLEACGRWSGIGQARAVIAFADGRSESAGESFSRVQLWRAGLPTPTLQLEIRENGVFLGRSDFAWEEFRTLGEMDGKAKYLDQAEDKEDLFRVFDNEKRREARIHTAVWEVVRWSWADLYDLAELRAKVLGSFALGRRFL